MYPSVIKVTPLDNYKLLLIFENGEERIFDFSPHLETGIFKELQNPTLFKSVRVSFDSVQWDNSADLDPEFLYDESVLVSH